MLDRLREAEAVVNAILDRIAGALAGGDRVELRGFGTFSTKTRAPRRVRNPRTGATVSLEERSHIAFKPG
ncbi:HU family DNA-binding protein [Methylobacterium sp. P31]